MTDAEFIKSWRDKLVRPNRLDVFTEDMCESLDRLERITAMWVKLKKSLLERAKGCGISSPVDLKRIQHFVNVTLAEMTALETAGPAGTQEDKKP